MAENRKLTIKQRAFADYYIKTGNATESAIKAGYSENTAAVIGHENLRKPNIEKYINKRQEKIDDKRIADGNEVLEILSKIVRDESEETRDRIRGIDLLGKRWQLWSPENREQANMTEELKQHMTDIHEAMNAGAEPHKIRHPDLEDDIDD